MTRRQRRSIQGRLLRALMLMTLLTLSLSTALYAVMDLKLFRDHLVRDLGVLAAVVGESCVSALVFQDPETAGRYLASLHREYQVRSALLLDGQGRPFARWARTPGPPPPSLMGQLLLPDLEIDHPLLFDDQPVGRLLLYVSLDELRRQVEHYLALGGLAALITLGLALALALRLQRGIAGPILALAERSRALSAGQDHAARLSDPNAGEEIATLVQGFNAVLAGLEARELSLSRHSRALDQANAKLRALALDLATLEETEKARLATELHDGPMQKLALAQMQIDSAARGRDAESADQIDAGLELLREATGELRSLQFDLSPPVLERAGLSAALAWLAESTQARWGLGMTYELDGTAPRLDRARSVLAFQCARELVNNLVRHARASRGAIRLRCRESCLEILVEDNGQGFAASQAHRRGDPGRGGYGLQGVCERIALVDGGLTLEELHPGARVRLWFSILDPVA